MIAATLLIAFALTFPIFANPIVPIIGAVLAVLTTIAWYRSLKWIIHQKPADKVPALQKESSEAAAEARPGGVLAKTSFCSLFGLFKPQAPARHNESSASDISNLMGAS